MTTTSQHHQWFSNFRDRAEAGRQLQRYPDPFFADYSHLRLPKSIGAAFNYAHYFFLFDPVISPILRKRAEYVVTEVVYNSDDTDLVEKYRVLYDETLHIKDFLLRVAYDLSVYGNAFASVFFPVKKLLVCPSCKETKSVDAWEYQIDETLDFKIRCACGFHGKALIRERLLRRSKRIGLILWDPRNITITPTGLGDYEYMLTIPANLQARISVGHRKTLETVPQDFITCVRTKRKMKFKKEGLFHLRSATVSSSQYSGWGIPAIFSAFKNSFLLQTIRKANEVTALEFVHPIRILYPGKDAQAGPMPGQYGGTTIKPSEFTDKVSNIFRRKRRDPTEPFVSPFPLGYQEIGGNGRALYMLQEFKELSELTSISLGMPPALSFGNASYSSASVSMRMLENQFLNDHTQLEKLLGWTTKKISSVMEWPYIKLGLTEFKMADDLARMGFMAQLIGQGKLGSNRLLGHLGTTFAEELESMKKEAEAEGELFLIRQVATSRAQAQAEALMGKEQMEFNNAYGQQQPPQEGGQPPPEGQGPPGGQPPPPEQMAQQILQLPEEQRGQFMAQLQQAGAPPEYLQAVQQIVEQQAPPQALPPGGQQAGQELLPPEEMAQYLMDLPDEQVEGVIAQLQQSGAPPEYMQALADAGMRLRQQQAEEAPAAQELPPADPAQLAAHLSQLPPAKQNEELARLQQVAPRSFFAAVLEELGKLPHEPVRAPARPQPTPGAPSDRDVQQIAVSIAAMPPDERERALKSILASEDQALAQAVAETVQGMTSGPMAAGSGAQSDPQILQLAKQIHELPEARRQMALNQLQLTQPELHRKVVEILARLDGQQQMDRAMKPLPEQLPPRRGPGSQLI